MTSRVPLAGATLVVLVVLGVTTVPVFAQNPFPQNFYFRDFFHEPPLPPLPPLPSLAPLPPLPPLPSFSPFQNFHFEFGQRAGTSADPEVALRQEVFRSLLRADAERALDIAAERLKADPADPVVLSNLPAIAQSTSSKALPLLLSIAKTSSNLDARRNAVSALSRVRNDKDGLKTLEELYNGAADNTDLRRSVVQSIARMSDPAAAPLLARIARTDADVSIRRDAARYLGTRGEPDVNKLLEDLLRPGK